MSVFVKFVNFSYGRKAFPSKENVGKFIGVNVIIAEKILTAKHFDHSISLAF